jgi:hypothetical protein
VRGLDAVHHNGPSTQVVEGGNAIQLRRRHAKMAGDIGEAFVGDPAPVALHDL